MSIIIKTNNSTEVEAGIKFIKRNYTESFLKPEYKDGNMIDYNDVKMIIYPHDENIIDFAKFDSITEGSFYENYEIIDIKRVLRSSKLNKL